MVNNFLYSVGLVIGKPLPAKATDLHY